jgi:thermostable 8-oxoguanine DNA glycosylase
MNKFLNYNLPSKNDFVIPGVKWGSFEYFPSPAYWYIQTKLREQNETLINYKIGSNLVEEICACLLGGHGIPAYIGLEAFKMLKKSRLLNLKNVPSENDIYKILSLPIIIGNKTVKYRFSKTKSKYIHNALIFISKNNPPCSSGIILRNWLLQISGIGFKTASWIVRNWMDTDDVAILDIHIIRFGHITGVFNKKLKVEKDYLEMENRFISFCKALDIKPSELDALIWYEMSISQNTVKRILKSKYLN